MSGTLKKRPGESSIAAMMIGDEEILLRRLTVAGSPRSWTRKDLTLQLMKRMLRQMQPKLMSVLLVMGGVAFGCIWSSLLIDSSSVSSEQFILAATQSFGLFDDIPKKAWELMQQRLKEHKNHRKTDNSMHNSGRAHQWYQDNYEPNFSCPHERRIGMLGDGGKWVCNPHRIQEIAMEQKKQTGNNCLLYSVGSNGDFSFEEAMANRFGDVCEMHTFDFTDYSETAPASIKDFLHFHTWGFKSEHSINKTATDNPTLQDKHLANKGQHAILHTLQETMEILGHTNRTVDIFKIDCEGCEWAVYNDWLKADLRQILVEVHKVPPQANDFFDQLQEAGYVTFHKEPNTHSGRGSCVEYSFLKLGKDFFM